MTPKRVQLSRRKGFKLPPNTVNVARPSKWGNQFKIGQMGHWDDGHIYLEIFVKDAATAVSLFEKNLIRALNCCGDEMLEPLRGKNLACWCKPGEPCHADVLMKYANYEHGQ